MATNRAGVLPGRIPPPTIPLVEESPTTGQMLVETNWYLFFYNIGQLTLSNTTGTVAYPPSLLIPIEDIDAGDADAVQAYRQIANAVLQMPDPEVVPTRDAINAWLLAADGLLQDPTPAAQPSSTVTLTGSPFTFTAPANGALAIAAGTVSAVSIVRQGVTVATGVTAGMFPVSRTDQVVITYTFAPAVVFLPT